MGEKEKDSFDYIRQMVISLEDANRSSSDENEWDERLDYIGMRIIELKHKKDRTPSEENEYRYLTKYAEVVFIKMKEREEQYMEEYGRERIT